MASDTPKDKYGSASEPIPVTRAYRRKMGHFDKDSIEAYSWILVNDSAAKVIYVNTYNGKVGRKWKYEENLKDLDNKKLDKKVGNANKPYEKVDVSECPIAAVAASAAAAATEAATEAPASA